LAKCASSRTTDVEEIGCGEWIVGGRKGCGEVYFNQIPTYGNRETPSP